MPGFHSLPAPDHPDAPKYWMYETSGVLAPAVEAYLNGAPMTMNQLGAMRAYLRQWINSPVWRGPEIDVLRVNINSIGTRDDIDRWLSQALQSGIDPL